MNKINRHTCSNGLQIITQNIPHIKTVAFNWGVRAGVASNVRDGESVLLAELIQRGVDGLDAKQHTNALDSYGVKRHIACGVEYLRISALLLGNRLSAAIPLLGAYLLSPCLSEDQLAPCKSLCMQSIQSIGDNPSQIAEIELNTHHLPAPYNRSAYGTPSTIEGATIRQLRDVYKQLFIPTDSIVVIVGDVQHEEVVSAIESLVVDWNSSTTQNIESTTPLRGVHWIQQDSSQTHLGIAFDGPDVADEHSILESVAMSIFGGATSGRLFTQVRQRRSLCYSVSAHYALSKHRSTIRIHAGTTPERASETAHVCLEQLADMKKGITQDEFDRTIQRMKSRTVMHGESTAARASAIWGDQYALGKVRTLDDRLQEIEHVEFGAVNEWLSERNFGNLTFVSVGPEEIKLQNNAINL